MNTSSKEPRWELKDSAFSVEYMYDKIKRYTEDKQYEQTGKALEQMKKCHEGQMRDGTEGLPYIVHPLTMACHAIALKVDSDEILAACLLHDVVEDCDVTVEELKVTKEIQHIVSLVTFEECEGMTRKEAKQKYFETICEDENASLVKALDRCNNVSTMAAAFTEKRMERYIIETETYILPMIEKLFCDCERYAEAAFALKYQIMSVLETVKRTTKKYCKDDKKNVK